ncbi:Uncharacterised protein [Mycobacteroides abscessus subsp. abscessus]|nr:Uncharacterised protein [Mycobacteroides abscessus subsp. abscessus]
MDREQRRRARGLHGERGAAQIELVRDTGRQVVLVVLQREIDHLEAGAFADDLGGVEMRHQVVKQVTARRAGAEHTDVHIDVGGVVAGVLECVPSGLQEQPMLRVEGARRVRGEAEELGIELVDPVHRGSPAHIVAVLQRGVADACCAKITFIERDDAFLIGAEGPPEFGDRIGAGKPACHADDRNRARRVVRCVDADTSRLRPEGACPRTRCGCRHTRCPVLRRCAR